MLAGLVLVVINLCSRGFQEKRLFKGNRKRLLIVATVSGVALLFCLALVMAQRPRQVRPLGRDVYLRAGQNLQAALDTARFGDTIVLESGATFNGPIVLPYKAGTGDYITIRTADL